MLQFINKQSRMQLNQNQNKKIFNNIKTNLINLINDYPINKSQLRPFRNLTYIIQKEIQNDSEEIIADIKVNLKSPDPQYKLIALKMLSTLTLNEKLKIIDNHQNDIILLETNEEYNYEIISIINDFLINIYTLIRYNTELYAASISRIISLYVKTLQLLFSPNKQLSRNAFELLRNICNKITQPNDKLILKIISILQNKMDLLLEKLISFEIRLRTRLFSGLIAIFVRINNPKQQFLDKIMKELLIVINNINEYECLIQSMQCIMSLLRDINMPWHQYNRILNNCFFIIKSVNFRREYLPTYIQILKLSQKSNNTLKYEIAMKFIQLSKHFQHQYTRLVVIKLSISNLLQIARQYKNKKYSVIISIFNQKWFVTKIKQDQELFREQFLLSLISEYFEGQPTQIKDILDICNRLLDWNCSMKNQSNIHTIKFTFDLYLRFLRQAYIKLGNQISTHLTQIITRINEQNINFLFKMKVLALLAGLLSYQQLTKQLKIDFIQGELRPFMMPKNPKQIFNRQYARSGQGIIQSAKQIQYIKNIMNLLSILSTFYSQLTMQIDNLIAQYHNYLTKLQQSQSANKNLINVLLELGDEPIITQVSKNFLLSIYKKTSQLAIYHYPYSCNYSFLNNYEQSIFPIYSPIQVTVEPFEFSNGKLILGIKTYSHLSTGTSYIKLTTPNDFLQIQFQSNIIQINLQSPGIIYIQVVNQEGHILAKSQYKVLINWNWKRIDWYSSYDRLKLKVFWENKGVTAKYLALYWGQPVCIGFQAQSTQLTIFVCSKEIIHSLVSDLQNILDYLTEGNLILKS